MRTWLKQFVAPCLTTLLLIAIACAVTIWSRRAGWLQPAELQIYDRWIALRPSGDAASSPILIVGMNDPDIARFGYPLSDRRMNEVLLKLVEANPASIGLDIFRDRPVADERPDSDNKAARASFLQIVRECDFIFVPVKLTDNQDTFIGPPETFDVQHERVASVNLNFDNNDLVRRGLLFRAINTKTSESVFSLGYKLAFTYISQPWFDRSARGAYDGSMPLKDFIQQRIAQQHRGSGPYQGKALDDSGYSFLLDFRGPRDFEQVSVSDLIDGKVKQEQIQNRVVIVAMCARSAKDWVQTPIPSATPRFGAEYHARVADQVIRAARGMNLSMQFWSTRAETAWAIFFCCLGAAVGWSARPPGRLFAGATGVLIALFGGALVLVLFWTWAAARFRDNVWIPVVPATIGFLLAAGLVTLYSAVTGRRDRSAMMQLIGHYVSDDVARLIWSERDDVFSKGRLRTRRLRGTVLFTDLRGFSTISEQLKAPDLMRWLNQYFQGLSGLVKQHDGLIMKFNGDQIVAVFGPPRKRSLVQCAEDARNAVRCAIRMRRKLTKLNARWARISKPQAAMRIGIHTGWLVAGSLGSRQRMEWTVIGDTVNTAARLESVKKDLMPDDIAADGCRILISDATAKMLDLSFDTRPLGRLPLKGKKRRVLVHGVKGFATTGRIPQTITTVPRVVQKKD